VLPPGEVVAIDISKLRALDLLTFELFNTEHERDISGADLMPKDLVAFTYSTDDRGQTKALAEIRFDASASLLPEPSGAHFHWDFGDGTTAEGQVVDHVFDATGTFTVRLTVTTTLAT
jgi:hypothetical protein